MSGVTRDQAKRVLMVTTASAAWFALLLQFPLTLRTSIANGMTLIGAILTYFSFFTLLTNLIVALVLTFSLLAPNSRWGRFFSSPVVATGTALYIATVGVVYSVLLRHSWNPEGLDKLADIILHDVVPVLYVAFWIFFVPKSGLRWRDPLFMGDLSNNLSGLDFDSWSHLWPLSISVRRCWPTRLPTARWRTLSCCSPSS